MFKHQYTKHFAIAVHLWLTHLFKMFAKITESKENNSIHRLDLSGSRGPGGQLPPLSSAAVKKNPKIGEYKKTTTTIKSATKNNRVAQRGEVRLRN